MLCGVEFQILTPWYKDCWRFVLFINGRVNMKEVEQRVGQECLTLDVVKYWFRLSRRCL